MAKKKNKKQAKAAKKAEKEEVKEVEPVLGDLDHESDDGSDTGHKNDPVTLSAAAVSHFAALEDSNEDESESEDDHHHAPANAFDMLEDDDLDELSEDDVDEDEPEPEPVPQPVKKKNKKKNKKAKQPEPVEEDDLDDILADIEGDKGDAPAPASKKSSKKKGKKKGKKNKQEKKQEDNDDLDDIMAELDIQPTSTDKAKSKSKGKPAKGGADDIDALLADINAVEDKAEETAPAENIPLEEQDESKLTKAQLKRLRKKKKEKLKAEGKLTEEPSKEEEASKKGKKKSKKGKGPSAAMKALKEQLQKQKEAEEELQRLREEEERRLEAERLAAIEEEKRRAEEEERRRQEKLEQRERLRREGKLLTKKQRQAQAQRELYLKQLAAQGVELPTGPQKKKPAYKKKRSTKQQKVSQKELDRQAELERAKRAAAWKLKEEQHQLNLRKLNEEKDALQASLQAAEAEEEDEFVPEAAAPIVDEFAEAEVADSWDDGEDVADSWDASESEDDSGKTAEEEAKERRDMIEAEREERLKQQEAAKESHHQAWLQAKEAKVASIKQAIADIETKIAEEEAGVAEVEAERGAEQAKANAEKEEQKRKEEERRKAKALASNKKEEEEEEDAWEHQKHEHNPADPNSKRDLRSPICCILGHVDTGKTKLLDKIRSTSVQDNEAGGITQQIGATYFPMGSIKKRTSELVGTMKKAVDFSLPGLLIIDTPGHESFTNLRSRGSNLCDIAILVVDIMHGLEPQTLESLNLLKQRNTPFVVALNKIDRMYGWNARPWSHVQASLKQQSENTQREFQTRVQETIVLFAEQGLNCCLYYENTDFKRNISLVPTSAHTGEGIPDLLLLLVQLTQNKMSKRLSYISELQCTVLEVKVIEGLGTTIDVVLVNGWLHENETIVVCGLNGPIVTTIRALLTPQPMRELRVKAEYVHHKKVKAAMGVKIAASGLENAVAGTQMLVCKPGDDIEDLKDEVMQDLATILSRIDKSGKGVCVQASTLGSLEALLQFLEDKKIPVSGIAIGPVHKKDVIKASVMLEHREEYAVILAFDVKVVPEAVEFAKKEHVKIFTADIIYHLFDMCTEYFEMIRKRRQEEAAPEAVFPCQLSIYAEHVFRQKDPIVMGVKVEAGILKMGTPLCIPSRDNIFIGRIISIEKNHQQVPIAKAGEDVAIKIDHSRMPQLMYGRQFDFTDKLYSKLSRNSIDLLKANFKEDLTNDDWRLVIKIKKLLDII